jgi:hypothetical protein
LKIIERHRVNADGVLASHYGNRIAEEINEIDLDAMDRYFLWRNKHVKADKEAMIRVEGNTAGIFSNDLDLLKTLEKIQKDCVLDYTEVDQAIPQGTKYYVEQPPHNYRVYLKSKAVDNKTKENLIKFIDRYKGTDTVIVPSGALNLWLHPTKNSQVWRWNMNYMSSHYFIDFDDDSTNSLFSLMFGELIYRRFKLEKRPEIV